MKVAAASCRQSRGRLALGAMGGSPAGQPPEGGAKFPDSSYLDQAGAAKLSPGVADKINPLGSG